MEQNYVVEMEHISKSFPGIKANSDITLRLKKGEIHALLGENGAGKSTLMSILFGFYSPDEGIIKRDGKEVTISDPNVANELGIGMVHQHFKLVEVFTVLENIILGVEPLKGKLVLNKNEARKKVIELSEKYGLNVDVDAYIEDISVGMQQRTEILKMLYRDNDVLIFDEPTAVLTPQEIKELLQIMKNLAKEGKSILFISHKLDEIMEVADVCSVLRRGELVKTLDVKNTTKEELSRLMVGRDVIFTIDKKESKPTETILKVRNLVMEDKIHKGVNIVDDISFDVKRGEIVCIAGIDGNGQNEVVFGITGLEKVKGGHVYLKEKDITDESIHRRIKEGISHIPADRHKYGLVLDYSLFYNSVLEEYTYKKFTKNRVFLNEKNMEEYTKTLEDKYDVRSGQGAKTIVRSMSGGNQQKAIIAREIERNHDLLIAVQPTRGLDVGAIENIHSQIIKDRDNNKAVLLVSFELDEVMNLADRILVMHKGKIVGEFKPKETTVEELGLYMAGAKHNYEFKEEN